MSAVRLPAHAGTFYPAEPEELVEMIRWSFMHPLGPGKLPETGESRDTIGYVVPHAGYMYSGPVAAHAYYDLARRGKPEAVVIVGPNHHGLGLGVAAYKGEAWRTPLGDVPVEMELAKMIVSNSKYLAFDNEAHRYEHSLEVQVPFLQYIFESVPIVPIAVYLQLVDVARDLAEAIARTAAETGADIVVLASTDFNHYEPHDVSVAKDEKAIEAILARDEEELYRRIEEDHITMCGPVAAATLIVYSKKAGGGAPILLKHATSGDVTGEKDWVVGYASIKFPS